MWCLSLSTLLISCWPRVNQSYLFISHHSLTFKRGFILVGRIFTMQCQRLCKQISNLKPRLSSNSLLFLTCDLEINSLMFEISSLKIRANMRVYISLQLCVCSGPVEGFISGWPFQVIWHNSLCWLLVSPMILQSKPSLLRGKYVQCLGSIYNYWELFTF